MPIYAYRCAACGHSRDVLQKMSDPVLSVCPACGADQFRKQVTAAGFQLKGSGWYATDFKGNGAPAAPAATGEGGAPVPAVAPAAAPLSDGGSAGAPAPAPAASAPAAASGPAGGGR
jgi:putative FmdB family regulatory protein